jgi:CRP/FNR family transcriptional regulator, cyclic AMP receptor protein
MASTTEPAEALFAKPSNMEPIHMSDPKQAEMIRKSKIGTELTEEQCAVLAELVEIGEYADGEVLVEEGMVDDKLRVILSGALAVAKKSADDEWVRLNVLTAGDLAGELVFLDSKPRYAALVALGPSKVFSLQRAKLESLLDREPLIVYRVMRAIARFAHEVLHRSGAQMAELNAYIFKSKAKY